MNLKRLLEPTWAPQGTLCDLPLEVFLDRGIQSLVLDVDCTLLPRHSQVLPEQVVRWVHDARQQFRLHLFSNMWYLMIFGDNIEDALGKVRYIGFYLVVGVLSFAVQIAIDPDAAIPTVGASGAIAGVLGAYALLYPRARVHCLLLIFIFIQFIRIPAILVLGFWFVIQVVNGLTVGTFSGVAWFAHIGGFVAGWFLIRGFLGDRRAS